MTPEEQIIADLEESARFQHEEYKRIEQEELEREGAEYYEFAEFQALREEHFDTLAANAKRKPQYPAEKYLVDGLLPTREVHIFAGASGVGKSTIMYDFIDKWQREQDVFGRKSHWYPYVIFSNDRSEAGIMRTLRRIGKNPKDFHIIDTLSAPDSLTMPDIIKQYHKKNPHLKVVFVEGLHVAQTDGNDYGETSKALKALNRVCHELDITIIGTTHSAKAYAASGMTGRDSIIGSAANAGMTETIFSFSRTKKGNVKVTIHPRNEREINQFYKWEDGRLVEIDEEKDDRPKPMVKFLNQLESDTFQTSDVVAFFEENDFGAIATAKRHLKQAVDEGWITPTIGDKDGKPIQGHWTRITS